MTTKPEKGRVYLKPGHDDEDHDHLMINGREIARIEYGDEAREELEVIFTNRVAVSTTVRKRSR